MKRNKNKESKIKLGDVCSLQFNKANLQNSLLLQSRKLKLLDITPSELLNIHIPKRKKNKK